MAFPGTFREGPQLVTGKLRTSCDCAMTRATRPLSQRMFFGTQLRTGKIHKTLSPLLTFHKGGPGWRPVTTISTGASLPSAATPLSSGHRAHTNKVASFAAVIIVIHFWSGASPTGVGEGANNARFLW